MQYEVRQSGVGRLRPARTSFPGDSTMNLSNPWLRLLGALVASLPITASAQTGGFPPLSLLAQIPQNFKTGWQTVLGLMCMIGFVVGVLMIWGGVDKARKSGDFAEGKLGILCGAVLAGSPIIMRTP